MTAVIHPGALIALLACVLFFGWVFWRWSRRSEDPPAVLGRKSRSSMGAAAFAVWSIVRLHPLIGVPMGAAAGVLIGILWGRNIGLWMAKPLASLYDGGDVAPDPCPFYAIAEAHRKQRRYADAIAEIQKQLDKFPGEV